MPGLTLQQLIETVNKNREAGTKKGIQTVQQDYVQFICWSKLKMKHKSKNNDFCDYIDTTSIHNLLTILLIYWVQFMDQLSILKMKMLLKKK